MYLQLRVSGSGFTIGRTGFGSVFWPGPIVLPDNLHADAIVVFRYKEVTVYPDESSKPPVGSGLNRRAEITLERVWPTDKTTRKLITDAATLARMKVSAHNYIHALNVQFREDLNVLRSKWMPNLKTIVQIQAHGCLA